jgi:hypothetical protein
VRRAKRAAGAHSAGRLRDGAEGRNGGQRRGNRDGRGWRVARDLEAVISRFALDEVRATPVPVPPVPAAPQARVQPAGSPIGVPALSSAAR